MTASTFTAVDVSQLPFPGIVEELDYETIYKQMRDQMNALQPTVFTNTNEAILKTAELVTDGNGDQYFRVPFQGEEQLQYLELESDPSARQLQIVAYREMLIRQRVNEACKGVMLAYAKGTDLENLGAPFGITRFLITPADSQNNIEAVYESDEDLRRRIQLAMEGFSTAGPEGAYIFHALNADSKVKDAAAQAPTFVKPNIDQSIMDQLPAGAIVLTVNDDVGLTDPMPGDVAITILSHETNGTATAQLQDSVDTKLTQENVRPITDHVRTRTAEIIEYSIDATLYTYAGPDSALVIQYAEQQLTEYTQENHKLGRDITLSGIYAALHQSGVQRVVLNNFNANIVCSRSQAAYCTGITINHGGVDE